MANLNDVYSAASNIDSKCYWQRFPDGKEPPGIVIREVSHDRPSYIDSTTGLNNWIFRVYCVDASYPAAKDKLNRVANAIAPMGCVQRDSSFSFYADEKCYEVYKEFSLWGEDITSDAPMLGRGSPASLQDSTYPWRS